MKKSILVALAILFLTGAVVRAEDYGVYLKVADKVEGSFDDSVKKIESALNENGWKVIASYNASVPEGCGFRAHTIVIHSPEYANKIIATGQASAFALPLRVELYEDESGINVGFVNPASINRTILGDDTATELSVSTMKTLSEILAASVKGNVVNRQIGEIRNKGKVGGMGGGDFRDKIEVIYKKEDAPGVFQDIAAKVKEGILANREGWKLIYTLEPAGDLAIYGVNKPETEARAYGIAGEKRQSEDYRCPGIDHAAAFPIEVIVYKDKGMVKVVTLDEMYRMKVYFEDAGNWAFMKNMRMPGQIEEEVVGMSSSKLGE